MPGELVAVVYNRVAAYPDPPVAKRDQFYRFPAFGTRDRLCVFAFWSERVVVVFLKGLSIFVFHSGSPLAPCRISLVAG